MRRIVMPISGYAGVGKDTFAKAMREACPDYKIVKFADALKDMAGIHSGCATRAHG